jgi:hypothetical protein
MYLYRHSPYVFLAWCTGTILPSIVNNIGISNSSMAQTALLQVIKNMKMPVNPLILIEGVG